MEWGGKKDETGPDVGRQAQREKCGFQGVRGRGVWKNREGYRARRWTEERRGKGVSCERGRQEDVEIINPRSRNESKE